jgi:xanthine dehydrogenase YagT iron-sulfur-binding subunit
MNANGRVRRLQLDSRVTLLDALREHLELPGTKGCDQGTCGAFLSMFDLVQDSLVEREARAAGADAV